MVDFSKAIIKADKKMINKDGSPREDILIMENNVLICHPSLESKAQEMLELFFKENKKEE